MVLAALYALGVAALLAPFAFLADWDLRDLTDGLIPFAILLGVAFVVLAVARRIGFVLLWLVLVGLWVWLLVPGVSDLSTLLYSGIVHPFKFAFWSVLAAPLFIMTTVFADAGTRTRVGRWSLPPTYIIAVLWIMLVSAGFILRDYGHPHFPWVSISAAITLATLGWLLWAPMPAVIAAVAVRAFWRRSRGHELPDRGGLTSA
jgi:hypothetical protein